jgi:hypothetical protein
MPRNDSNCRNKNGNSLGGSTVTAASSFGELRQNGRDLDVQKVFSLV